jgi:Ca-activated chloride channel family protein
MTTSDNPRLTDDPRLTAYALGELDGAEKAEVEQRLANDAEARQLVSETRALAAQLTSELSAAPEALTDERRAAIDARLKAAEAGAVKRGMPVLLKRLSFVTALAAALVLSVSLFWAERFGVKAPEQERSIARRDLDKSDVNKSDTERNEDRARAAWNRASGIERKGAAALEDAKHAAPAETAALDTLQSGGDKHKSGGNAPAPDATIPQDALILEAIEASKRKDAGETVRRLQKQAAEKKPDLQVGLLTTQTKDGRQGDGAVKPGDSLDNFRFFEVTQAPGRNPAGGGGTAGGNFGLAMGDVKVVAPDPAGKPNTGPAGPATGTRQFVPTGGDTSGLDASLKWPSSGLSEQSFTRNVFEESRELEAAKEVRKNADAFDDDEAGRSKERGERRQSYHFTPDDIEKQLRYRPVDKTTAESYQQIVDNRFKRVADDPLSTFSIDVDTASYANVRRFLTQNQLPPRDAVRIEELLNYFSYDDPAPTGETPFAARMEIASCPWNVKSKLLRIGVKGRVFAQEERKPSNFVFLVDVSGSMAPENKLPLLKEGLKLLVNQLTEMDNVGIVTYAGSTQVALPSTNAGNRQPILTAIDGLHSGGSTAGASGIQLAYEQASRHFLRGGVNRVILLTDGDFNVGITDQGQLQQLIEEKAKSGVFLSVLGFGMGNVKDDRMEMLADKGNGNYSYIDTLKEARKVLVDQMNSTLVTIAKDVKLQLEFNPAQVLGYRLIGYENRVMAHQDFNDDRKDAGEIGAGHSLTALFEIYPAGSGASASDLAGLTPEPLKYQRQMLSNAVETGLTDAAKSGEILTLKIRYKEPEADTSKLLEFAVKDAGTRFDKASDDFRFAAAVASFGMLLRESPYRGSATFAGILEIGEGAKGKDPMGYRREFLDLVLKAKSLAGK